MRGIGGWLVVAAVGVGAACSDEATREELYCEARCGYSARCGKQDPSCLELCTKANAAGLSHVRGTLADEVTSCYREQKCGVDACVSQAVARAYAAFQSDPEYTLCSSTRVNCQLSGKATVSDDQCLWSVTYDEDGKKRFKVCMQRVCEEMSKCLEQLPES